eukprot:1160495-Pelagomonas_calceolata.AAC.17
MQVLAHVHACRPAGKSSLQCIQANKANGQPSIANIRVVNILNGPHQCLQAVRLVSLSTRPGTAAIVGKSNNQDIQSNRFPTAILIAHATHVGNVRSEFHAR